MAAEVAVGTCELVVLVAVVLVAVVLVAVVVVAVVVVAVVVVPSWLCRGRSRR